MRNKSVVVLDVRSAEIRAAVAEKGVNGTFIIKSKYSCEYDGYAEGKLIDVDNFTESVKSAVSNILASGSSVKQLFVGVPCEFVETILTDKVITFPSARKISVRHIEEITDSSMPETGSDERIIDYGAICYTLSDKRKLIDPIGMISDSLNAKLCFFTCKISFMDCVKRALSSFPEIRSINWVPQNYSQALYLIDPEKRDGYAMFLDIGYISSTFSVACGDGIVYSEAFSIGVGHIAVLLMQALDIPYPVALALTKQVNLNAKDIYASSEELSYEGEQYSFPAAQLHDLMREGLDGLCEMIETCIQSFKDKDLSGSPMYITGEGVGAIRGMTEHISSRLVTPVEVVTPKLPYYDKTKYSSLFSLLAMAINGGKA